MVVVVHAFLPNGLTEARETPAGLAGSGCRKTAREPCQEEKGAGPAYLFLDGLVTLLQPAPPPPHVLPVEDRHIWQPRSVTPAHLLLWPAAAGASPAASPPPRTTPPLLPFSSARTRAGSLSPTEILAVSHPQPRENQAPNARERNDRLTLPPSCLHDITTIYRPLTSDAAPPP